VFLDNIVAASYKTYGRYKNETPYFSSVLYLLACFIVNIGIGLNVCKLTWGFSINTSKPTWYTGFAVLAFFTFRYYSKSRVEQILKKYELKSKKEKRIWGILAVLLSAIPILIAFLLSKYNHDHERILH